MIHHVLFAGQRHSLRLSSLETLDLLGSLQSPTRVCVLSARATRDRYPIEHHKLHRKGRQKAQKATMQGSKNTRKGTRQLMTEPTSAESGTLTFGMLAGVATLPLRWEWQQNLLQQAWGSLRLLSKFRETFGIEGSPPSHET